MFSHKKILSSKKLIFEKYVFIANTFPQQTKKVTKKRVFYNKQTNKSSHQNHDLTKKILLTKKAFLQIKMFSQLKNHKKKHVFTNKQNSTPKNFTKNKL